MDDIGLMLQNSLDPFEGTPISSVASLRSRCENVMEQARRVVEQGQNIPITFFVHTNSSKSMRFVPNMPKPLIMPSLMMLCQTNPEVTSVVMLSEVWALLQDGEPTVGGNEAREWVESGRPIREHPDSVDSMMVNGAINIASHGKFIWSGLAPIETTLEGRHLGKPKWMDFSSAEGAMVPPQLTEMLQVVEDADFLLSRQAEPHAGRYEKMPAAGDWS